MPTFEIGLDDGRTLHIEADSQEAALAGVQHFLGNTQAAKDGAPSGALAGFKHGAQELVNSDSETAKDFYGVGDGAKPADPNYVPANITNGSIDPREWNYSQVPQKIAEMAPGLAQDIAAAKVASMAARPLGAKAAAIAGLGGGAVSAWHRMAGNDAKADAVRRTGDENAQPEGQDLARAGLTDAAASAAASLLPTRFGASAPTITNVGRAGVSDAVKKYLTTAADSAAATSGSDAISQVGNTGTIDPKQTLEAAVGGAITGPALATPRLIADAGKAARFKEFGGDNQQASEAVASRLTDAAPEGLGNTLGGSKVDARALSTVKSNIKGELQSAAADARSTNQLSVDANNALRRAQRGEPLTADDIQLLDNEAPGTNAAFLARQARVAQLLQDKGTFSDGKWAGGVSGMLDKAVGKWLPKAAFISAAGEATGHDFIGAYAPHVIGGAAAGYLGSRALDSLTGMRSPAKAFANTFENAQAATRIQPQQPPRTPTPPTVPPVAPPQASPWGYPQPQAPAPAPLNGNALNTQIKAALQMYAAKQKFAAQAAAASQPPPAPTPAPIDPLNLPKDVTTPAANVVKGLLLKQKLMAANAPQPEPAPIQVSAPQVDPLNLPRDITAPSSSVIKGLLLRQKLMAQNAPQTEPEQPPSSPAVPAPAPEVDPTALPKDITGPAKTLMSALAKVQKMKDAATAQPAKITKTNGKVESDATPSVEELPSSKPFTKLKINTGNGYEVKLVENPDSYKISFIEGSGGKGTDAYKALATWAAQRGKRLEVEAADGPVENKLSSQAYSVHQKLRQSGNVVDENGRRFITPTTPSPKTDNSRQRSNVVDPYATHETNPFYEPVPDEAQYKNGMTIDQIAEHEAQNVHPARREKYRNGVRDTTSERIQRLEDIANDATPDEANVLAWLKNQLLHRNSAEQGMRAVVHTKGLLSPETYARVKKSFSPDVMARVFNNK
jgi:hypothetical protein